LESEIVANHFKKPKLQEMIRFYLDKFGAKVTKNLKTNNVLEWYNKALGYELARLEFLDKFKMFTRSIIGTIDLKVFLFLVN